MPEVHCPERAEDSTDDGRHRGGSRDEKTLLPDDERGFRYGLVGFTRQGREETPSAWGWGNRTWGAAMTAADHLSDGDLIAWEDETSSEDRRARLGAHLAGCPACRARLAEFQAVERLLQERFPPVDDPIARERLLDRLRRARRRPPEGGSEAR